MRSTQRTPLGAASELILATLFWGFGFVGAIWALRSIGPFWMSGLRFLLAFLLTVPLMVWRARQQEFKDGFEIFKISFWPGLYLTMTILFQTVGLKYTTATNSGFITTLYVVFVPIIEVLYNKKPVDWIHLILVVFALIGTALICQWQANIWNLGDLLTLICAIGGALHIVCISHYAKRIQAPFFFNNFQCFWAGLFSLGLAVLLEDLEIKEVSFKAILGFSLLLFGSTLFGFWAQVRAQRVLSASSASLICLLESPFSAFFAYFFLYERLNLSQWLGAFMILVSAFSTIILENYKNKSTSETPTHNSKGGYL